MTWKKAIDVGIAAGLIAGGAWLYRLAGDFPMGAGTFPKALLVSIIGLAGMMLIGNLIRRPAADQAGRRSRPPLRDRLRPYLVFLGTLAYLGLILGIGFFPATLVMGLILFFILEVGQKWLYLTVFGGTVVFVYVLFAVFLNVPLPQGYLFH